MAQHHLQQLIAIKFQGKSDFFEFYDRLARIVQRSSMPRAIIVEYIMNGQQVFSGNARKALEVQRSMILTAESTPEERKKWIGRYPQELLSAALSADLTQEQMDVIEDAPVEISDLQLSRIISVIVMNFGQINKIFEKQQ
eukprot:115554_1